MYAVDPSAILLASKGSVQVMVSDSHVDDFVKNRLRLLAEVAVLPLLTTPGAARQVAVAEDGNGNDPEEVARSATSRRR